MVKDFPGTFPGSVLSGNASSPITVHYAGHVGVGMTVVVIMGNAGPAFKMFPAVTTPPVFQAATLRPAANTPLAPDGVHADSVPPVWSGAPQGAVTSVNDSAGNTYHFDGLQGGPESSSTLTTASGFAMPVVPWLMGQLPDVWLAYCVLTHAVDASTVLSIHLSAAATFYVVGDGFAGATDAYGHNLPIQDAAYGWFGYSNTYSIVPDTSDTSPHVEYPYGWPTAGPAGPLYPGFPNLGPPGGTGNSQLFYQVAVQQGPSSDHSKLDVAHGYSVASLLDLSVPVGAWDMAYGSSDMTALRHATLNLPDADVPTSSVPDAFTLTAHSVHADGTAEVGGKRLDMTFESDATFDAGDGFVATCLDGNSVTYKPSWAADFAGSGPPLASHMVTTPSGPQEWGQLLAWWRGLIADATLNDPTQTGVPALLDLTIYVTPTVTAAKHQECGASLVTVPVGLNIKVTTADLELPGTSGLVSAPLAPRVLNGALLVDGTVTATGVPLTSTVTGHELGFRLYDHYALPAFATTFDIGDLAGVWNTMSVTVRVQASIYFKAPRPAEVTTPDVWDPPEEPSTGPPIPEGDGTGGTLPPTIVSALVAGDSAGGAVGGP